MEKETPDFGVLIDLLRKVISDGLPHDRKKAIMLQMHSIKTYSRREHLPELTLNLLDIEESLRFGQSEHDVDNERLEALIARLSHTIYPEDATTDKQTEMHDSDNEPDAKQAESGAGIELTICNCTSRDEAREIAHGLVESGLAACVNIIANIGSIYRWEGEIVDTSECQLHIKSSPRNREAIQEFINTKHSNEIPEIISVPIEHGNVDYLAWVLETTEVEVH